MLDELSPEYIEPILEMTLKNTTLLRWKMVHVARKFGAFSRDVDYQRISMARLLSVFEGTPMYKEALREIYHDRLDLPAKQILEMIHDGRLLLPPAVSVRSAAADGRRKTSPPEHADAASSISSSPGS
jgi:ATP-dependent Lhr-like helicase